MTERSPRVVLASLDGFNHAAVSPETTPRLWALATSGGRAPTGGRCDVPAVTYVCHATLMTGTTPATHGIITNHAATPRPGIVPGWAGEARTRTPTLFQALRDAGVRAAAICGDQHLVGITGAAAAESVWPPQCILPEGTPLCASGYATNQSVRAPFLAAVADRDLPFLFAHLNETDTWGHRFGPEHEETLRAYTAADALVGAAIDTLAPDWDRTVMIVLSDHGMEPARPGEPVSLRDSAAVRTTISAIIDDGGAALAKVKDGVAAADAGAALLAVPGVASWREILPGVLLVEGEPGVRFGTGCGKSLRGVHGGPGTTVTTAIVGGGHSAVPRIAAAIAARPPHLADWAPTMAALLAVPFPSAEGVNLAV
jgi:arylsulfatase A-like enzyme